jgi:hypothetical protein
MYATVATIYVCFPRFMLPFTSSCYASLLTLQVAKLLTIDFVITHQLDSVCTNILVFILISWYFWRI